MQKISIVVPVYNEEVYLDECVASICNQSYKNLEIILVDDGSRSSCADKCDEYLKTDSRIKVIHKENGGSLSARKAGIFAATGDYVIFVDADDWIEPGLCEEYSKWMSYKPDMIASTNYYRDYENGVSEEVFYNKRSGFYERDKFATEILSNFVKTTVYYDTEFPITMCMYAFETNKARERARSVDDNITNGEDLAFLIAAFFNAETFAATPYRGYHYRLNRKSKMSTMKGAKAKYKITYDWINKQIEQSAYDHRMFSTKNDLLLYHHLMFADYDSVLKASDKFLFPYTNVQLGSSIIVYGIGLLGRNLVKTLQNNTDYTIVAIADSNYKAYEQSEYHVISPEDIVKYNYDYIVIAVSYINMREDIKKKLKELGIDESKIAEPDVSVMDGKLIMHDL